jgi:hypothetical protein
MRKKQWQPIRRTSKKNFSSIERKKTVGYRRLQRNTWLQLSGEAKKSGRFRMLKAHIKTMKQAIWKDMNTPIKMRVFSWNGEKDTTLTPMDSIRYYKHFLHIGFLSMDPNTGYIKAWVGGIDYKHLNMIT